MRLIQPDCSSRLIQPYLHFAIDQGPETHYLLNLLCLRRKNEKRNITGTSCGLSQIASQEAVTVFYNHAKPMSETYSPERGAPTTGQTES